MKLKDKIVLIFATASLVGLVQLSFLGLQLLFVDLPNISKQHIQNLQKVHNAAQSVIDKLGTDNIQLQKSLTEVTKVSKDKDVEIKKLKEQVLGLNTANTITLGQAQQIINEQNNKLQEMSDAANRMADFVSKNMMLSSECIVVRDPPCMNAEISGHPDACGF